MVNIPGRILCFTNESCSWIESRWWKCWWKKRTIETGDAELCRVVLQPAGSKTLKMGGSSPVAGNYIVAGNWYDYEMGDFTAG